MFDRLYGTIPKITGNLWTFNVISKNAIKLITTYNTLDTQIYCIPTLYPFMGPKSRCNWGKL